MKKELVESILDKWEFDHPLIKDMYKKDSEEIERIICRIGTDNQDFIIKGIPNKEESIIQSNVQAHLFLGNEHSMAPKLFPAKEGTYYIQEQGYYFYLKDTVFYLLLHRARRSIMIGLVSVISKKNLMKFWIHFLILAHLVNVLFILILVRIMQWLDKMEK